MILCIHLLFLVFFFNDTATTEIYTLSLHDALPICLNLGAALAQQPGQGFPACGLMDAVQADRKSTRLNSSHTVISYAVFCLKKKKTKGNVGDIMTLCLTRVRCWHGHRHVKSFVALA